MIIYNAQGEEEDVSSLKKVKKLAVYPGSYNPLHKGHRGIYEHLTKKGFNVYFELSRSRYRKAPYSDQEISKRMAQFKDYAPILITDAPLFFDKQRLLSFTNPYYVMGYDTADRWLDANEEATAEEQELINAIKLLVFGRLVDGEYNDPRELFTGEEEYRIQVIDYHVDISSTELRNQGR